MVNKLRNKLTRFLRWTEKYTKTDMLYLTKGGFWLSLGHLATTCISLSLAIGFANLVSQETYGIYRFVLSFAGVLSAFTLTGIAISITQAVAKGFEGTLRAGFSLVLRWSIFIFLASVLVAIYYFIQGNLTLAIAFLFVGVFVPIIQSSILYSSFLNGKKYFGLRTLYNLGKSLIPALLLIGTILITNSPIVIIFVHFAGSAFIVALIYYDVIRRFKPNNLVDQEALSYGKYLSPVQFIGTVSAQLDAILIFHFLGAAAVAVYTLAFLPVRHLQEIARIIKDLLLPKLSIQKTEVLEKTLPRKTFIFFLVVALPVTGIYILLAPHLFSLLFPLYRESVFFSQILALGLLFMPDIFFSQYFISKLLKRETYIYQISSPVVRTTLLVTLIPFYGIWGVVVAHLIGRAYSFLAGFVLFVLSKRRRQRSI